MPRPVAVLRFVALVATAVPILAAIVLARESAPQIYFLPHPALPAGTGTITGRVLTDAGRPASGAHVFLKRPACRTPDCEQQYSPAETISDADGRFTFADVGRLPVVVEAALAGFAPGEYGQAAGGLPGAPLAMRPAEQIDIVIRLTRGASVSGTMYDNTGAPVAASRIYAFRLIPEGGDGEMLGESPSAQTNDYGRYEFAALPAGRYIIAGYRIRATEGRAPVIPIADGQLGFETGAAYPNGEWLTDADPICVTDGEVRSSIDLRLRLTPVTTVSGRVRTKDEKPVVGARVYLGPVDQWDKSDGKDVTDAAGRFRIDRVEAGRYLVVAVDQSLPRLWARGSVETNGREPVTIDLTTEEAGEIAGRIVFDGRTAPPAAPVPPPKWTNSVSLSVNGNIGAEMRDLPIGGLVSDWVFPDTFLLPGIPPGRYSLSLDRPPGWWMRSQIVDGLDALDHPFAILGTETRFVTITLTDKRTTVAGSVTNAAGQPHPAATVVVFSTDSSTWTDSSRRVAAIRPDQHGEWEVVGLPEGDYWVAIEAPSLYGMPTPARLGDLRSGAARVTLREGQRTIATLRTKR